MIKLTCIVSIIFALQLSANTENLYSQITRIDLEAEDMSLEKLIWEIKEKTEFDFFYSTDDISHIDAISLDLKDVTINEVLFEALKKTDLEFNVVNRAIIIKKLEKRVPLKLIPISELEPQLQEKVIKGIVTDTDGIPLPGVNVVEKGTTNGTITNVNGEYTISLGSSSSSVLVFSYIGYLSEEIVAGDQLSIDITLVPDVTELDEIVVIGYGTQDRANISSAIVTIKSEDIVKTSNNDVTNNLTGRAPGIRVVQMSSEPGKFDSQIDIRGYSYTDPNDITGAQKGGPLFIVDGVPRDKAGFDRLDPNEIESLTILKDASAAIYGVKAANGVVLVTTKTGKAGKMQVSYTGQSGIQSITQYPSLSNAYQYATLFDEMHVNNEMSNRAELTQPKYTREEIEAFRTGEVPSTDWLRLILNDNATQQQHNLSLNGGSEKIQYFASAGYFDEKGLYKNDISWAKKYNLRLNVTNQITKNLEIKGNIGLINTLRHAPQTDAWAMLKNAWKQDPTEPVYANDNPQYIKQFLNGDTHPLAQVTEEMSGYKKDDQKFLTSTFELTYKIPFVEGLKASALYAYDINYSDNKSFRKKFSQYEYNAETGTYRAFDHESPSSLSEYFGQGKKNDIQLSLRYANSFGKHNIQGLLLYEQVEWINNSFDASTQFKIDAVDHLFAGLSAKDAANSGYGESSNRSYVGRVNYVYSGKYMGTFSFRYDGSSKFPEDSRWGFFPSGSVAWRISEEPFIKNNIAMISNLKLRASYGVLGDDQAADFQFLTGYTYPDGGYQFGTSWISGLGFKNSANPNITWYTSTMTDFGLEGAFWNNLLSFDFGVFRREREGLLAYRNTTIPATYGTNLPQENLNGDRTEGYELVVGHTNSVGDLFYSISANMSYARTKNRYLEETPASNDYDYWRNRYTDRYNDVIWGYKTDGQFQSYEEIYAAPIIDGAGNRTILPGDIKYVDVNGDGIISNLDETVIGRGQSKPSIYFGSNISLSYKNFDLSMLLQGATMYQVLYQDQLSRPFYWGVANPITEYWDRWHREDILDPNSKWIAGKNPSTGERQNYKTNEFWLKDASYIRLKSIEVGYTIPNQILAKYSIESLRLFVNGYNVYTWSKELDFVDPEYTDDRLYSYNYPITMNINFGVQLNF